MHTIFLVIFGKFIYKKCLKKDLTVINITELKLVNKATFLERFLHGTFNLYVYSFIFNFDVKPRLDKFLLKKSGQKMNRVEF